MHNWSNLAAHWGHQKLSFRVSNWAGVPGNAASGKQRMCFKINYDVCQIPTFKSLSIDLNMIIKLGGGTTSNGGSQMCVLLPNNLVQIKLAVSLLPANTQHHGSPVTDGFNHLLTATQSTSPSFNPQSQLLRIQNSVQNNYICKL